MSPEIGDQVVFHSKLMPAFDGQACEVVKVGEPIDFPEDHPDHGLPQPWVGVILMLVNEDGDHFQHGTVPFVGDEPDADEKWSWPE